ncbi:hypothetical protein M0208_01465 [Sphingomonas sp. SUN019]|uniref:hypothetical protein n=1 Tax=Sphingomonas sp. SUN019 TaxID=2937788 RepID=UPI0021645EB1|nr:hypothetical protein [Sphingomonas sp. SUN019]UVO49249.1 hypothetical protein M0208_01465 [Sphingomonas sp. SUN019]
MRKMDLGYGEKAGLQIYRNYTRSFEDHALRRFREGLAEEPIDVSQLSRVAALLTSEDVRFAPVIACGYADEQLEAAFKAMLPEGIPGGRRAMFSGYGPLSDLSKRIRLAYAFDVLSRDVMLGLDRVRTVRNRISHDWDMKSAVEVLDSPALAALYPIDADLRERGMEIAADDNEAVFRIRLIWLVGRLTYEVAAYHKAKAVRLSPIRALYENGGTAWLREVSGVCMAAARSIATNQSS